jgi:hypothetical protein
MSSMEDITVKDSHLYEEECISLCALCSKHLGIGEEWPIKESCLVNPPKFVKPPHYREGDYLFLCGTCWDLVSTNIKYKESI